MKRSGFKMNGMSFRQGQSPIKNINEQAFKAAPPGSSREELLKIAEGFTTQPKKIDLDYGGEFEVDINIDAASSKEKIESKTTQPKVKKHPKLLKDFITKIKQIQWNKPFSSGKSKKENITVGKPIYGGIIKD